MARAGLSAVANRNHTPPPLAVGDDGPPIDWSGSDDENEPVRDKSDRQSVRLVSRLDLVVDNTIAVLATDAPRVFQRDGKLVRIVYGPRQLRGIQKGEAVPRIASIRGATMKEILTRHVRFTKRRKTEDGSLEEYEAGPPTDAIYSLLERAEYGNVRPLAGILEAPALRADGTVLQGERRYDAATGLYFEPSAVFPVIAENPTHDDAKAAARELLDVVKDFPFASDAHRAAWLAGLLTLFARPAVEGPCPLIAIDATTPGTGKGLLTNVTTTIAIGGNVACMPAPQDDAEMRKRITGLVMAAEPVVLLDNIRYPLEYPSLEALLTGTEWRDRELGSMAIRGGEARGVWFATGNNLVFAGDLVRRVLHIRLETALENPQERDDFEQDDLMAWVNANRGRFVKAALTMLRAFFVAGKPGMGLKPWGSFEAWTRIVAACVVWVGLASPLGTQNELTSVADESKLTLAAMLDLWTRMTGSHGATVGRVLKQLYPPSPHEPDWYGEARETLEAVAPLAAGGKPSPKKIGNYIRERRRRIVGGRCFEDAGKHQGAITWTVRTTAPVSLVSSVSF